MSAAQTQRAYDTARAEAFAGTLLTTLNSGALSLMLSIGHRTGLFDVMCGMVPATSHDVATKAGLNERYVREWLNTMVCARLVDYDPATSRYSLPAEHAAYLTREAASDNLALFFQYVGLLAGVEDDIVECFKQGGGVPYERYPRFHAVMAEDSEQSVLSVLATHVLPLVPGLTDGLDAGIAVLDVGCGSGRILNALAAMFPSSRFAGMDLSPEAIDRAGAEAAERGLTNVEFTTRDVTDFDDTAPVAGYDLITSFDAVHDQAQPLRVLKGINRALRSDGVYLMQDIRGSSYVQNNLDHPVGVFLYTTSCMHCMTVSLAAGGEGLGTMWGEEKTREYLERAGFRSVERHQLAHDFQNNWYVVRQ
jgi:2-polyprenyl-3-methyl-5-hydroxy-6-metoxy-1,4-benzoquinol methylase